MRYGLRAFDGLEGTVGVEITEPLVVSFGHNAHCMVGHHAVVVASPKAPDGQMTFAFGETYKTAHEGVDLFRYEQGVEGMRSAIGVPATEGGEILRTPFRVGGIAL